MRKIEFFIPDGPSEEILDKPQLAKRLQVSERMLELMESYRWSDVLESLQAQTQRHLTTSDAS